MIPKQEIQVAPVDGTRKPVEELIRVHGEGTAIIQQCFRAKSEQADSKSLFV